jgi:hypothetical protein
MSWLVTLSAEEHEITVSACRTLAATYHRDAEPHSNIIPDAALQSAGTLERTAERMKRARECLVTEYGTLCASGNAEQPHRECDQVRT